jgi:hypothetical protein
MNVCRDRAQCRIKNTKGVDCRTLLGEEDRKSVSRTPEGRSFAAFVLFTIENHGVLVFSTGYLQICEDLRAIEGIGQVPRR